MQLIIPRFDWELSKKNFRLDNNFYDAVVLVFIVR